MSIALKKNLAFLYKNVIGSYAASSWSLKILEKYNGNLVQSETDLVIAGFPRSGNTFFYSYISIKNPEIKIVHHNHLPFAVHDACMLGIPTAFLIRHPLDTLCSLLVADPRLSPEIGAWSYLNYYRKCMKYKNRVAVSDFSRHVDDPSKVTDDLNMRFATNLRGGPLSESERTAITDRLKANTIRRGKLKNLFALPTAEKDALKQHFYASVKASKHFSACERVYEEWRS